MKRVITIILSILSFSGTMLAQSRTDAVGVALGRATVASAFGVDAINSNPANISILPDAFMSFTLSPVGVMAGNSMMSLHDVNYYFGGVTNANGKVSGRVLDDKERDAFLAKFSQGSIASQMDISLLNAVVKLDEESAVGFSITTSIQSSVTLPENLGSLIAGYAGFRRLEIKNMAANALAYTSYQASYSAKLFASQGVTSSTSFYGGASAKFVRGLYYTGLDDGNTIAVTPYIPSGWDSTKNWAVELNTSRRSSGTLNSNNLNPSYFSGTGSAQGNGAAIDIGATLVLQSGNASPAYISMALLDLGAISWADGEVETITIQDTVKAVAQLDNSYLDRYQPTKTKQSFSTMLPARLRMGGSMRLDDALATNHHLNLMAEYTQGFNHIGANTTTPRLGVGVEATQNGYIPALRMGTQIGGIEGFMWTAGFGWKILNTVSLDASVGSMQTVVSPSTSKWIDGAFRVRVDI